MQKTNYGKYWGRKDLDDSNCDRLDNLISASLYINIANEARAFLAQDISGIRENPHLRKRILRNTEKRAPRTKISASRIALIACLVATILLLSACICLPKVRESIWNTLTLSCKFNSMKGAYYRADYTFVVTKNSVNETITKTTYKTCS